MIEELKDAVLIEGSDRYYVTPEGRVFSVNELVQVDNQFGYKNVQIKLFGKQNKYYVHRIVAKTFHPNPYNLSQVDHIDGMKDNNHKDNLQWLSGKENIRKCFRGDYQLVSPEGIVVKFNNIRKFADENGLDSSGLSKVLKGKHKVHKGWRGVIVGPTSS